MYDVRLVLRPWVANSQSIVLAEDIGCFEASQVPQGRIIGDFSWWTGLSQDVIDVTTSVPKTLHVKIWFI
jgi:hypothetical protein